MARGVEPRQVIKTLVVRLSDDDYRFVLVPGDRAVTTVVSQGCRPVGDPFVVTRAEGSVIAEIGGSPALAPKWR